MIAERGGGRELELIKTTAKKAFASTVCPLLGTCGGGGVGGSHSMRRKARGLARHGGGPPGWLEESGPAGYDFVLDERSIPPEVSACSFTKCTQNTDNEGNHKWRAASLFQ